MMITAQLKKKLPNFELQVDFQINNEFLVIIGPSGAGKTTLLQCLAGLQNPSSGKITLGERTVYCSDERINVPARQRNIGYVFQDYALFPHMTVKKNVMYGIRDNCKCQGRYQLSVYEVLEMLGITYLQERYPRQISGGEKQRVALARALMTEPDLLLLDEPLSALDHETRGILQQELRELQRKWQIPFILVTHDLQEAQLLGDKMIRIDRGQQTMLREKNNRQ